MKKEKEKIKKHFDDDLSSYCFRGLVRPTALPYFYTTHTHTHTHIQEHGVNLSYDARTTY